MRADFVQVTRASGEHGGEPVKASRDALAARFDEAVGEQGDDAALGQLDLDFRVLPEAEPDR
jgi:hypothetical protein